MKATATRLLLYSGLLIPIVFWTSTIIGGILHENYNHFQNTVSELGAIGSKSEEFMMVSTWICVLLSILFFIAVLNLCRQVKLNTIPLVGILGFAIMFGWAATFHSGNPMHSKGGAALLLLLVAPLFSAILWKGKQFQTIRLFSGISLGLMLLILLRIIPSVTIQKDYTGLIQRFVHLGWSVWFVSLSLTFLKRKYFSQQNSIMPKAAG